MLRKTSEAGMCMQAIRPQELQRLNVDTTVQTKAIRFPTDARKLLGKEVKEGHMDMGYRVMTIRAMRRSMWKDDSEAEHKREALNKPAKATR